MDCPGKTPARTGGKALAYESLSGFNEAVERMLAHLRDLKRAGTLDARCVSRWQCRMEELRAEINRRLTGTLHAREEKDWARFGRRARGRKPWQAAENS